MAAECPISQWDKNAHIDNLAKADYLLYCFSEGAITALEYIELFKPINEQIKAFRRKLEK